MTYNVEAGRAVERGQASEVVLWRNTAEVASTPIIVHQAARIARRFVVGDALARVIAEHAYAAGTRR